MQWVASNALAIVSALLAAVAAAVGIVARQAALSHPDVDDELSVTAITGVFRNRLWWAGTAAAVAGYAFQALALAHGSILLVQPLIVSSLLFVLPLNAFRARGRVTPAEWGWAFVLTAALTVFVLVGRPDEGHYQSPVPAWAIALAGAVPTVLVCLVVARRSTGRVRAMSLAVAVAVGLGMIAVLTKICTHRFAVTGWHGLAAIPAPYVLVALAVGVTIAQQWAFRAGALQASVPIMLVGEPVVAVALGAVVLGEQLTVDRTGVLVLPLAVVAMLVATVALGRASGAHAHAVTPLAAAPRVRALEG
ncbi:DMT family transporter [Mycolicibacterium komossense]|uniref:DMT family transporter n=1 Tax=Mycolicibacterium komossense TaxID=1779 RepID=A0ABT3C7N9_9MYCO|nr:DMT family transporter [Mycolicibacterium komossense]MCV7225468.1 DMT family transporter [Mycolicibacterium komossense]